MQLAHSPLGQQKQVRVIHPSLQPVSCSMKGVTLCSAASSKMIVSHPLIQWPSLPLTQPASHSVSHFDCLWVSMQGCWSLALDASQHPKDFTQSAEEPLRGKQLWHSQQTLASLSSGVRSCLLALSLCAGQRGRVFWHERKAGIFEGNAISDLWNVITRVSTSW